jgi:5'-deoxynucleotidase YfbR-like HD superfamily hydrolase
MTLEEFTSEHIHNDVDKLQYLYKLKSVTRYNTPREIEDDTESVAEHLYGMQLLCYYFLPLEDPDGVLDKAKISALITTHDLEEVETGDYVSYIKTEAHRLEAEAAIPKVLSHVPHHIQCMFTELVKEYEAQLTRESQFVKAIDKLEPLLQVYNEKGKIICHRNKCTAEDSLRIKEKYIESFPYIKKFALTLHQTLIDGGYYWQEGE